ncbi:MAG TPA: DUF3099 domain-containing protein [Catenuloplanes sp.]
MRRQSERPVLITDAVRSQDDQLRRRQTRYIAMMSIRAGCLVLGAILISYEAPLLPVWLSLCAVGMVVIPWLAVLLANDRPPKKEHRRASRYEPEPLPATQPRALPTEPPAPRTIDVDP